MWSEDRSDREVLAWLLQPYTIEDFANTYYEKAPLVVSRSTPGYYRRYFSLAEMERVLYGCELEEDDLRIFKDGVPARAETYLRSSSRTDKSDRSIPLTKCVDADRVSALFAHGCTVVLDKVQTYSNSVLAMCRGLETFLRHRVNANVYMTPPQNQGFAVHYDTHDTVILQIEGAKHWRVYGSAVELPLFAQKYDKKKHPSGEVQIEVDLHAGDLLYLPRGVMHEAKSTGELSLHVTIGLHPVLWTDVLDEAVKEAGLDDVELRRVAFESALQGGRQSEALMQEIQRVVSPEHLLRTLQKMRSRFVSERRNVLDGQLVQLVNLPSLSDRSRIAIREHMLYELREEIGSTVLAFSGKEIRLPATAAAMIRELKSASELDVASLKKHDANALGVIKRLIEEGFAVQLEPDEFDTAVIA